MTGLDFLSSLGDAALIIAGANTISAIVRALTTPGERVEALQQARDRLDGALRWAEQQQGAAPEPEPTPEQAVADKPAKQPKPAAKLRIRPKPKPKGKPTPETHPNHYRVCMRCDEQKFLTAFRRDARTCRACERRIEARPATLAEAEEETQ